jgi:glycerophosphoryl diester phosphodiesterase
MNEVLKKFLNECGFECIDDIKWAHAVNNVKYLEQALNDPKVGFLEVDISLSNSGEPIAAHYQDESDLTFANLLNKVKQSDKGIKLDFKDQRALLPCLQQLEASELQQPVILNADVLSVKDAPPATIEASEFIKLCRQNYPKGLLSVGWRTNENSVYSAEDIDEMLRACEGLNEVSFAIRASALPHSWENIKKLIEKERYTLTIWSAQPINKELKGWIIKNTDPQKCFYDFVNN